MQRQHVGQAIILHKPSHLPVQLKEPKVTTEVGGSGSAYVGVGTSITSILIWRHCAFTCMRSSHNSQTTRTGTATPVRHLGDLVGFHVRAEHPG